MQSVVAHTDVTNKNEASVNCYWQVHNHSTGRHTSKCWLISSLTIQAWFAHSQRSQHNTDHRRSKPDHLTSKDWSKERRLYPIIRRGIMKVGNEAYICFKVSRILAGTACCHSWLPCGFFHWRVGEENTAGYGKRMFVMQNMLPTNEIH